MCSESLLGKMSPHAKDIENFKQKTTIIARHLVKKLAILPHFKKIVLKHAIDHTLTKLDAI